MIQNTRAHLANVTILGDLENVFMPYIDREDFPELLRFFLEELIKCLLMAKMMPATSYSRLYLEKQNSLSKEWHTACETAAKEFNFDLYWSMPHQPAEDLLAQHIEELINDAQAPQETLVISRDGDLAPHLELLKRWDGLVQNGTVCTIGWRHKFSRWLKITATGTVFLEDLVPQTLSKLLLRSIERHKKTICP